MNFCGLDHRQVLDMESAASKIPESVAAASGFQCGGVCARVDEDDFFGTGDRLPDIALDSSEDPVTDDDVATEKTGSSEKKKLPVTNALDNIQQTLEDNRASDTAVSAVSVASVTTFSSSNRSKTKFPLHSTQQQNTPSSRNQVGSHTPSPSPSLLNPLTTKWKELATVDQPSMPTLLFPIPDIPMSSPTLEALMQRLEGGFRVRLTGGPISCLAGEDSVCLYLHDDRSRLCFVSDSHPKRSGWIDENKDEGYCWIEIPVTDILRLEIGGNNKSSKSFSIVIEKERGCLVYYDFEASSAIDREVIVSTLILLLDNTHNARSDQDDIYDWSGGTMDQPILCSPSLDHPIDFSSHVDQLIVCSPSLEHDPCRTTLQLSPRRRTQIYSNNDNAETETSLVIHLEDFSISDSNASRKCTEWYRRELPSTSLQQKSSASEEAEDIRLDFKPSASSTQLGICANHSTNIGTTAWCAADSCALALNDIADTCTGIFALKQNESTCAPTLGKEQRVVIEKFIASALGAPTAMYSYLTEGDIWNIETSVSNQEPKDTTIRRNRASILNAQAARLRGLRNEMTFAAALKQSKERMHFVQTVQSFDDAYTRVGGTKKLRAANEAANRFHSSPLLKSIVDSMVMHDPDGHSRDEEIAYYDSDPEDSRPLSADKGPRQMAADRLNRTHETKIDGHYVGALNGVGFEDIGTNKKVSRKIDEEAIVEIVQVSRRQMVCFCDLLFSYC